MKRFVNFMTVKKILFVRLNAIGHLTHCIRAFLALWMKAAKFFIFFKDDISFETLK